MKFKNGWLEDKWLFGAAVERRPVLPVTGCVRSGLPLKVQGVTLHNTGNAAPSADARAHARWLASVEQAGSAYVGAHFFVDAERIVQTLPVNEVAWHAGDGANGRGNRTTLAIEICETAPYEKAEALGIKLATALCRHYGVRPYIHQDWSGKACPRKILARGAWPAIRQKIIADATSKPAAKPQPAPDAPSAWAKEAVAFVKARGYMVGDGRGFRPHDAITREEVAAVLKKVMDDANRSSTT